jgi:hypothetical protein
VNVTTSPGERRTIVVGGMLAGVPRQGGASWAVLQYILGLRRLGHEVLFLEPVQAGPAGVAATPAAAYFDAIADDFELRGAAALLDAGTGEPYGLSRIEVEEACGRADLLLNLSGVLDDEELLGNIAVRAFVDLDPAFTQLWQAAEGIDMGFDRHNRFVTIGQRIGSPGCSVPTCGRSWITTPQPVVLDRWPVAGDVVRDALTTIGHWRAYGSIEHKGVHYGQKAHSLRPLMGLPATAGASLVLGLGIHPEEADDIASLRGAGWRLVDPDAVAGTPSLYQAFVRGSWAEFGLAKAGYVAAGCGWFSDRSACYLASGRPVIAQDTGFGGHVPVGEGLLSFRTADDVAANVEALRSDYPRHRRAAREIAETVFHSDRVLRELLECL